MSDTYWPGVYIGGCAVCGTNEYVNYSHYAKYILCKPCDDELIDKVEASREATIANFRGSKFPPIPICGNDTSIVISCTRCNNVSEPTLDPNK